MKVALGLLVIALAVLAILWVFGNGHRRRFWLLALLLLPLGPAARDTRPCLNIEGEANLAQAERVYLRSCHWVEENITSRRAPLRPCVTVRIVPVMPDSVRGTNCEWVFACFEFSTRTLYMKEWNAGAFSKAVLLSAFLESFPKEDMDRAAQQIIDWDAANFVDVR